MNISVTTIAKAGNCEKCIIDGISTTNRSNPRFKNSLLPSNKTLPIESINPKVIINEGEVVERVYQTQNGDIIFFFTNPINEEAA